MKGNHDQTSKWQCTQDSRKSLPDLNNCKKGGNPITQNHWKRLPIFFSCKFLYGTNHPVYWHKTPYLPRNEYRENLFEHWWGDSEHMLQIYAWATLVRGLIRKYLSLKCFTLFEQTSNILVLFLRKIRRYPWTGSIKFCWALKMYKSVKRQFIFLVLTPVLEDFNISLAHRV